jgi:methyl-accepting chemotaxis protein
LKNKTKNIKTNKIKTKKIKNKKNNSQVKISNKFSIGVRIRFVLVIIAVSMMLVALVAVNTIVETSKSSNRLNEVFLNDLNEISIIDLMTKDIQGSLSLYVNTEEEKYYDEANTSINELDIMLVAFGEKLTNNYSKDSSIFQSYNKIMSDFNDLKVSAIAINESINLIDDKVDNNKKNSSIWLESIVNYNKYVTDKLMYMDLNAENFDKKLYDSYTFSVKNTNKIIHEIYSIRFKVDGGIQNRDDTLLFEATSEAKKIFTDIQLENSTIRDESAKKYLEDLNTLTTNYTSNLSELSATWGVLKSNTKILNEDIEGLLDEASAMVEYISNETNNNANDINTSLRNLIFIMILMFSITIVIIFVIFQFLASSITKPIRALVKVVEEVTKGNLAVDIHQIKGKDEISNLNNLFIDMIKSMKELISKMMESSGSVALTAKQLNINAVESIRATEEVAGTINEIASGASKQANETEDAAAHVETLGDIILKNNEGLASLNKQSNSINHLTAEGVSVLEVLIEKSKGSEEAIDNIFEVINQTNNSAETIGNASQMIRSIAEQTNLLSLNAAIEAARAGESGRGFAVVADEIRKLAEQSANTTAKIDSLLANLITNTKKALDSGDVVKEITKEQSESVVKTKNKYDEIKEAIEVSIKEIDYIVRLGNEMEDNRNQVMSVIENLSAIAEENAASTEETASASQEMLATMEEVTSASNMLSDLSQELKELINSYKID